MTRFYRTKKEKSVWRWRKLLHFNLKNKNTKTTCLFYITYASESCTWGKECAQCTWQIWT